jgi:serine/threonine-protein kinase
MSKYERDVWKARGWERGDQIPGGNQGHTFLARKGTDPLGEYKYVLKSLKHQDDQKRRAMFSAEVQVMEVVDHPGVAKVVDTNAKDFREPVELFLVTERILGTDLEKLVKAAPLPLDDAVRVTNATLGIVNHCHELAVIHRDIKPCHVILQNDSLGDPVLIDFGLAYHGETQPIEAETEIGRGKGNRFLVGPEHHAQNPAANRNAVTDICQCVGLFYFALTQQAPGLLQDDNGKKPHQRLAGSFFAELKPWKRKALLRVFDVGFEWNPIQRWQRIDHLIQRLAALLEDEEPVDKQLEHELSDILGRFDNSHTARLKKAQEMSERLVEVVQSVADAVKDQTQEHLTVSCGKHIEMMERTAGLTVNCANKVAPIVMGVNFYCKLSERGQLEAFLRPYNGNLSIFENGQPLQLGSYDLGSAECADLLRPKIVECFAACVREALGIDERS